MGKFPSTQFIKSADYHQGGAKFSTSAHSKAYISNLHDLEGCLHVMIKSTFIPFRERWFRQNIGISVGIGPAPFFANLYLAKLKLEFMIRLRDDAGALNIRVLGF